MRLLYLHIGHLKTGSTFIQSALTANRATLRDLGVDYPVLGDDAVSVDRTRMTPVGNARSLLVSRNHMRRELAAADAGCDGAVYSSETMFDRFSSGASVEMLVEEARRAGFDGIRVLLFTRNPIAHGASVWQQRVKGWQAETASLDDWLANDYAAPVEVLDVLRRMAGYSEIAVTVRNYSRCRGELLEQVSEWLGVPAQKFTGVRRLHENRSLTAAEAIFQHALNREIGKSGELFAFRIVEALPDVKPEPLVPSREAQEAAWARLGPAILGVNELVGGDDRYEFDPLERTVDTGYSISEEQLRLIAMGVGMEIEKLQSEVARLRRSPIRSALRAPRALLLRVAMRLGASSRLRAVASRALRRS